MNMCPFSISRGWRDSAKNRISGFRCFSNRFSQTIAFMGTDIHQMYLKTESGIFVNLGSQDGIFLLTQSTSLGVTILAARKICSVKHTLAVDSLVKEKVPGEGRDVHLGLVEESFG